MSRVSRGCQQCRTRKVKCDQGRPSCQRCQKRGDRCSGYRDESSLIFRSENGRVESSMQPRLGTDASLPSATFKKKLIWKLPAGGTSTTNSNGIGTPSPSTNPVLSQSKSATDDSKAQQFFDSFVMYPCNSGSSLGFLEHLPSLFQESNVKHRYALRYAVLAAAHASMIDNTGDKTSKEQAFHYYGLALSALSESLKGAITEHDDHILMAIVVLDIFESLYCNDSSTLDSHVEGMKYILRLREPQRAYDPKGWSLSRLSHHRMQRYNLVRKSPPMPESSKWLDDLDEADPFVGIEKSVVQINEVCERARQCLKKVDDEGLAPLAIVSVIREMHSLDQVAVNWHDKPHWKFRTVSRFALSQDPGILAGLPERIQLHTDAWMAYEWNYHRTARILMHRQLLSCLDRLAAYDNHDLNCQVEELKLHSISIVRDLVDEILATVPQSLGDINNKGKFNSNTSGKAKGRAVGAYFLLWPIKIIKQSDTATPDQGAYAEMTFERIREYTGMKSAHLQPFAHSSV